MHNFFVLLLLSYLLQTKYLYVRQQSRVWIPENKDVLLLADCSLAPANQKTLSCLTDGVNPVRYLSLVWFYWSDQTKTD